VKAFILILLFAPSVWAVTPQAVELNKKGIKAIDKKNYYQAYKDFVEALSLEPFNSRLKINLGLSYELNEEFDKAYKEFLGAYKYAKDDKMKFMALFNAAQVKGVKHEIEPALNLYQRCLELNPESIEVKTNIELLMKQGQGGGKGKQQQNKKNKQGKNKNDQDQKNNPQNQQPQKQKKKPKPFKSKELTKDDVRKILEEIKNQEQKIREKEYGQKRKERPNDKDW